MVVPHPEILFDGIILTSRNIYRMISAVTQALRDQMCITFICFDSLTLLGKHSCRCKYDTFDPGSCKLVIKSITKATRLVTAFNRIIIVEPKFHFQRLNKANDLFIVRGNLHFSEYTVF